MNQRPAVIDGVLKEILDRFHFQSLWSPRAPWQLNAPPPSILLQLSAEKKLNCQLQLEHLLPNDTFSASVCVTDLFSLPLCSREQLSSDVHLVAGVFTKLEVFLVLFSSTEEVSMLKDAWQTAENQRQKHICFLVFLFHFFLLLRPYGGDACDWYFVNAKAHRMNP